MCASAEQLRRVAVAGSNHAAVQRVIQPQQHEHARQRARDHRSSAAQLLLASAVWMNGISREHHRQRREIRPDQDRERRSARPAIGAACRRRAMRRQPQRRRQRCRSSAARPGYSTIGLVAVRIAAVAPAMPPASCRRDHERRQHQDHAAIGVSQKIASCPNTAASGAISTDMPGAQIGDAASARTGDGMNPPGASVRDASGHGASTQGRCRLQLAARRTPSPSSA